MLIQYKKNVTNLKTKKFKKAKFHLSREIH